MYDKKKIICIALAAIVFVFLLWLLIFVKPVYEVTFISDDKVIKTIKVKKNEVISKPELPQKEGHIFETWYHENKSFDFSKKIKDDITLTAKWIEISDGEDEIKVTISFDSDGGTNVESQTIKVNTLATKPTNPEKEGYKFIEWQLNSLTFDFSTYVTENITLTAKWEMKEVEKYTVTFDTDGGSTVKSQTVESGKTVTKPQDPTKEDYIFKGWYNGNIEYNFATKVTKDITLTAKWEKKNQEETIKKYTVTFNPDGGSAVKSQTVESGKTVTKPQDPTKENYIFKGWYNGNTEYNFATKVTKDMTLTAKWEKKNQEETIKKYTVTFDADGGSTVKSQTVESGKTVAKPQDPTKENYTFKGWYNGNTEYNFATKVTKDITLTAKWERKEVEKYTVTFDTDGGSAVKSQTVESGKTVTKPQAPTKENHIFKGWYNGNIEYNFATKVTKDIVLTAKWERKEVEKYTVTFDTDGGSAVKSQTVESGKTVTKPQDPTKENYIFKGWYNGNIEYNFATKVTKDITLTAKWEKKEVEKYTVTFDTDGGSAVKSQTVESGKTVTKPQDPTKENYIFKGWYNGNTEYNFATKVTKDIILTAKWEKKEETLMYGKAVDYITSLYNNETYREAHGLEKDDTADKNIRYSGKEVNNYVEFNDELWRIVGIFNVSDGTTTVKRIKLIKESGIGYFSWDSSNIYVNNGAGVNEWSVADLNTLLNNTYYNRTTSATCYNGWRDSYISCDFRDIGLGTKSKTMIAPAIWNTGAVMWQEGGNAKISYQKERGTATGKICKSDDIYDDSYYCTDTVDRTLSSKEYVGLIYPSDYLYASKDTNCRTIGIYDNNYCKNKNWLHAGYDYWLLSPHLYNTISHHAWVVEGEGKVIPHSVGVGYAVRPSVYLKSTVNITGGDGSQLNPYTLSA